MNCCHPFTGNCEQAHGCPVRETPDHSRTAFSRYCEASKQPCAQPYQCAGQCVIESTKLAQWQGGQSVNGGIPIDYTPVPRRSKWLFWTVLVGAVLAGGIWIYRSMI